MISRDTKSNVNSIKNQPCHRLKGQYILDLLTVNEELKKFPKESLEVKRNIIEDKVADLQGNAQFIRELTERLNRNIPEDIADSTLYPCPTTPMRDSMLVHTFPHTPSFTSTA